MAEVLLEDLISEVVALREKEAQIKAEKEAKEVELAQAIAGKNSTMIVGKYKITQRSTITYKLNDSGMEVMNSIDFSDKLWKKTPDAKLCLTDSRFTPDMVTVSEGKVALTIKSSDVA